MEVLERTMPPQEELIDFSDLYGKASKLLGYEAPGGNDPVKRYVIQTLSKLDIAPFTSESVSLYKAREMARANFRFLIRRRLPYLLGFAALAGGCIEVLQWINPNSFGLPCAAVVLILSLVAIFGIVIDLVSGTWYTWDSRWLVGYAHPIPEFVLATAVKVQEELKLSKCDRRLEWELRIVELSQNSYLLDPFLILKVWEDRGDGSRRLVDDFYLEKWNEPNYKEQRVV